MKLEEFKKELLKDPEFRKEYFKKDLRREIAYMIIEARIAKGITQEELAEKMGTKQPAIARIESGNYLPNLKFLEKAAQAIGTYLIPPRFAFLEKKAGIPFNIIFEAKGYEHPDIEKEKEKLVTTKSVSSTSKTFKEI
jgi:transcriptional regulator with XRE-family HTH domain